MNEREEIILLLNEKFSEKTSRAYEKLIHKFSISKNLDYFTIAYEKIGQLIISDQQERKIILDDLKNFRNGWNCEYYNEYKINLEKIMSNFTTEIKVEEGDYKCRNKKCKSTKCRWYQSQDRSGDEGFTIHVICTECSGHYTINS